MRMASALQTATARKFKMKIQLDLSELENQIVELFKALHKIKDKKTAIKKLIREHKDLLDKLSS